MIRNHKIFSALLLVITFFSFSSTSFADEQSEAVKKLKEDAYTDVLSTDNTKNMSEEQMLNDNIFVEDGADVLSKEQELDIYKLNKNVFENLKDKPQIAVVTLKYLPENMDIDEYRNKKFEELGVGQKGIDNGLLFVIAVSDRPDGKQEKGYGLEVGYGLEHIITDSMKEDIVDSDVISFFRSEQYGDGIIKSLLNIKNIMIHSELGDNQTAIDNQIAKEKRDVAMEKIMHSLGVIFKGVLSLGAIIITGFISLLSFKKLKIKLSRKKSLNISKEILIENNLTDEKVFNSVIDKVSKLSDEEILMFNKKYKVQGKKYVENQLFGNFGVVSVYKNLFKKEINSKLSNNKGYDSVFADDEIGFDYTSLEKTENQIIKILNKLNNKLLETKTLVISEMDSYKNIPYMREFIDSQDIKKVVNNVTTKFITNEFSKNKDINKLLSLDNSKIIELSYSNLESIYSKKIYNIINNGSSFQFINDRISNIVKTFNVKELTKDKLYNIITEEELKGLNELKEYNDRTSNILVKHLKETDWEMIKNQNVYNKLYSTNFVEYFPNDLSFKQINSILSNLLNEEYRSYLVRTSNSNKLSNYKPYNIPDFEDFLFSNISIGLFATQSIGSLNSLISDYSREYSNMKHKDNEEYLAYKERKRKEEERRKREKDERRRRREEEEERRRRDYYNSSSSSSSSWSSGGSSFGGGSSGGGGFSGGW